MHEAVTQRPCRITSLLPRSYGAPVLVSQVRTVRRVSSARGPPSSCGGGRCAASSKGLWSRPGVAGGSMWRDVAGRLGPCRLANRNGLG